MNHRERVRRILNHQEADRPAIDLGSTEVTGTSGWSYRALKRALGVPGDRVRVYNMIQMLVEVEAPVLDALDVDFAMLPPPSLAMGLRYGDWKPYTFWDGQTFEVPADLYVEPREDGALLTSWSGPEGPLNACMPDGGRFFDMIPDTDWNPLNVERIPESDWLFVESLTDETLRSQQDMARALYEETDRSVVAMPQIFVPNGTLAEIAQVYQAPGLLNGFFWFAGQLTSEPEWCRSYLMRAAEAAANCLDQYLQAVSPYIDVLVVSLMDYGMQEGEWFRPELFGEFFVPAWRLCTDVVHRYPNVKTWIHCCGSVPNLVPYFIEAGIDCLNPVQWTAAGMDLPMLKEKYGKDLVFWGGATSTQRTFPFGTPDQVAEEARDVLDIMAPGGGFVVNPIHNILPEVPVENILALYRTALDYRY